MTRFRRLRKTEGDVKHFDARLLKTIPGSQSLTVFGNPFHKGTVSVAEEVGFKRLPANTQGLFFNTLLISIFACSFPLFQSL